MFGKFRIVRRIAQGGFADVYRAHDTVEGIHVALKIPHPYLIAERALDDFLKEVRITARLDHPNILHLKNASFIYGLGNAMLPEVPLRLLNLPALTPYFYMFLLLLGVCMLWL